MEGAVAVESDLMVKCNAKRKLWNCSVIIYEDCGVCIRLVAWKLPVSLRVVKLVEL